MFSLLIWLKETSVKRTTSYHRYSCAIAVTALAGCLISSVALAANPTQTQLANPASMAVGKNLSIKNLSTSSLRPDTLAAQPQRRSMDMTRWLQLRDDSRLVETFQEQVSCHNQSSHNRTSLCRVQWHRHNGLSGSRNRFQDYSYETNRSFTKHLANHLEIDIGRSPSISLRYDFY